MKRILITGKNSYVGKSLEKWLGNYPDRYLIELISLRDDSWKEKDFSKYEVVIHVAGIAHIKETKENVDFYYKVNRDLAFEVAQKAKNKGVKQFIFFSTMSVYGIQSGVINKDSQLNPKSNYGRSKLQAEELITPLEDKQFKIAIIRPPMIYGKSSKGNYGRLANLALNLPVFPNIKNSRSMIYINNLCEFIRLIINDCSSGIFFPQNEEYICTSNMVMLIAKAHSKSILFTKLFNPVIKLIKTSTVNKVFGDLVYEKDMSKYREPYCLFDIRESILETEVCDDN